MADERTGDDARRGVARWMRWCGVLLGRVLRGAYAAALIAVILWASYRAIRYLIVFLLLPPTAPPQITQIPRKLDDALLRTPADELAGITAAEHVRAPMEHFHRLDDWFQVDRFNDCTRSGCHSPLPHTRRKEVRAFLNMHATSIHCAVCHYAPHDRRPDLLWYDLDSGEPIDRPALLAAYDFVTSLSEPQTTALTAEDQDELVRLLRAAGDAASSEAGRRIAALADSVAAPRPGGAEMRHAVAVARAVLPNFFRGEYGAKIALRGADGRPLLSYPNTREAVSAYLSLSESAGNGRREELTRLVHLGGELPSIDCELCHREEGSWIDLRSLGYPPARIDALHNPWLARTIEHMVGGQTLRLPRFVAPGGVDDERVRPASQPAGP
ncbi:MAG: hypothetical protein D6744_01250 [Planctomycetota bacterium]|nr:MAG: hypothetical protein D6744_01250 [Planctomycetota bacterium]